MKKTACSLATVLALLFALALAPRTADARPRGNFGIGLELGRPTGLTVQYFMSRATALDFALGLSTFDNDYGYLHIVFKAYLVELTRGRTVSLPLYLGLGGFASGFNNNYNDDHLGMRVPLGIDLDFRRVPVQIFFEVALRVALLSINHDHGMHTGLDLALGFRFYF